MKSVRAKENKQNKTKYRILRYILLEKFFFFWGKKKCICFWRKNTKTKTIWFNSNSKRASTLVLKGGWGFNLTQPFLSSWMCCVKRVIVEKQTCDK